MLSTSFLLSPPGWLYAVLAAAALLIPILLWSVQRLGGSAAIGRGRRIEVREVVAIDARRRILIARCDGREVVVLIGGPSDVLLGWLPAGERPQE